MRYRRMIRSNQIKTYEQWRASLIRHREGMCSLDTRDKPCRRPDKHQGLCTWEGRPVFETDERCPRCAKRAVLMSKHVALCERR